jgi:hypothetical protein
MGLLGALVGQMVNQAMQGQSPPNPPIQQVVTAEEIGLAVKIRSTAELKRYSRKLVDDTVLQDRYVCVGTINLFYDSM